MSEQNLQKVQDAPKAAFPWRLLWLDLLGSLLVAVGFLQFIAQGLSAIALAQMVLGFALMVPLIRHFLTRSNQRN
ncbi:MAG: hypothetical protein ACN4EJ_05280 [Porticoccaceae bacterium]